MTPVTKQTENTSEQNGETGVKSTSDDVRSQKRRRLTSRSLGLSNHILLIIFCVELKKIKQELNSMVEYPYNSSYLDEPNLPLAEASPVSSNESQTDDGWVCSQCTLLNPIDTEHCDACMLCKPNLGNQEMTNQTVYTKSDDRVILYEKAEATAQQTRKESFSEEDPLQKKRRRRRRRRIRMVAGAVGGLIVGAIIFAGPAGVFAGAVAGAAGTRIVSKRRERRKDEHVAQQRLAAAMVD